MDADFWHRRWELNEIAFHEPQANPLLVRWFSELSMDEGDSVFVPLCGKSLDIHWLLSAGFRVAGAELSELAVKELFVELELTPTITETGRIKRYAGDHLDVYVGDFFDLSTAMLGKVDAIYDRAALVAMPARMRDQYAHHLMRITDEAPQLVICFEYDQELMEGPPFSIGAGEMNRLYGDSYLLRSLARVEIVGGLKGICAAKEHVWALFHG